MTSQGETKQCLGCGGHSPAEYVWHDGFYRSYVCEEHAKKQLPRRGSDDLRETKLENGGRNRIVSGYATPIDDPETKIVWQEEVS